jgi:Holliday junction resolvase
MNSKQKGSQFERQMAAILRAKLWPGCYVSRTFGSAWDDNHGVDLTGTPGFNCQLKFVERLSPGYHEILAKMPQSKSTNIVIHKRNDKGAIVALRFEDFIKLIKK